MYYKQNNKGKIYYFPGQNVNIILLDKIFSNVLLFVKYLVIYHIFKIQVRHQICRVIFYRIRVLETQVTSKKFHGTRVRET